MMASFKQYLFVSVAAAAFATATFSAPAFAQYHQFRSEKPTVEVDLDALAPESTTPATRPGWQKPAENTGNLPPVVLRQPLPPMQDMPRTAPVPPPQPAPRAAAPQAVTEAPPAAVSAAPAPAPRRVLKPMFAAPVAPPPVTEAQPVQPLAEPVPARSPAIAAPAAAPARKTATPPKMPAAITQRPDTPPAPALRPAKLMEPVYEKTADTPRPAPKPAQIAAPQPQDTDKTDTAATAAKTNTAAAPAKTAPLADSRMSYPPVTMPRSDVRHFERPVLPEGLRSDEYAAPAAAPTARALPADSLPQRKPPVTELPATILNDEELAALTTEMPGTETAPPAAAMVEEPQPVKPAPVPAAAPAARRPSLVVIEDAPVDLPRRMPVTTTLPAPSDLFTASRDTDTETTLPIAARAETVETISALPAPKPLENIPPPLTAPELAAISKNIETVPARVAIAPPRLLPQDIVVPTLADLTLEFDGASSELSDSTRQKLVNIVPHLTESDNRRLAVHAYASGEDGSKSSARRISLSRALAVRAFLMDNGVPPTRVDVRALGLETDRKPLERVDLVFAR